MFVQNRGIRPSEHFKKFQDFHNIVVKASSSLRQLIGLLNATNQTNKMNDSSSAYSQLKRSLEASQGRLDELQVYRKNLYKKDKLKQFKCFVASILESDDACAWMEDVTNEELEAEGGSANRLYQLFKEGKGNFVLHLEPELMRVASQRSDLFSSKQCGDFMLRAAEIERKEKQEEEEIKAAEKKRVEEEAERKRILLEIKRALIGSYVIFQSLSKSGEKYNGNLGLVLSYLENEDRYKVQYRGSLNEEWVEENMSKVFAVKPENIKKYYGYIPTPPTPPTPLIPESAAASTTSTKLTEQGQSHAEMEANLESKRKELIDILFQDTQVEMADFYRGSDKDQETQHQYEHTVITSSTLHQQQQANKQIHQQHQRQYQVSDDSGFVSELSMEKSFRGSENRPPANKKPQPSTTHHTNKPQQHKPKKSTSKKDVDPKISMISTESSNSSSRLTNFSTMDVSRISKAFDPMSGTPLCRFGKRCRDRHYSCRFYHPKTAKSILLKNEEIYQLFGHNNQKIKPIISKSGAWIGVHKKNEHKSVVEIAGDEDKVEAAITMINHIIGVDTSAYSISTNDEFEMNSIPTSVLLTEEDNNIQLQDVLLTEEDHNIQLQDVHNHFHHEENIDMHDEVDKVLEFICNENKLLNLLISQQSCIKGSAKEFYNWLVVSEDICTVGDLAEAVLDEDYIRECLQPGNGSCGIKGFKRKAFKNAVLMCSEMG